MHQNWSAESNRRLPKYDLFHTACWVPWLCCRSPIHHSNILVCQLGPLDNTQTASQNLFVNLSRVYRNRCTREVTFAKWSAFIWLLWIVTRLHAGNRISSLENYVQNIFLLSFYRCCGGLAILALTPIFRERGTESNICECKNQVAPPCHKTSLLLLPFHPSQECKQPRSVKNRFRILVHFSCKSSQILPQHRYLDCQDQRAVLPWIQRSNWLCSAE